MERKFITVTKTVTEQVAANRVRITLTAYGEAKKYAAAVESASEAASAATQAFSGMDGVSLKSRGINVTTLRDDKKTVARRMRLRRSSIFRPNCSARRPKR